MVRLFGFSTVVIFALAIMSCGSVRFAQDGVLESATIDPPKIAFVTVYESSTPKAALFKTRYQFLEITPIKVKDGQKIFYSLNTTCTEPDTEYSDAILVDLKKLFAGQSKADSVAVNSTKSDVSSGLGTLCVEAKVVEGDISSPVAIFEYRVEEESTQACVMPTLSMTRIDEDGSTIIPVNCGDLVPYDAVVSVGIQRHKLDPCDQLELDVVAPDGGTISEVYSNSNPFVTPLTYGGTSGVWTIYLQSTDSNGILKTPGKIDCNFEIGVQIK